MAEYIFKTSFFGNQVIVYPDRLFFKKFLGILGTTDIPINQIAGVDITLIGIVIIETTGGKRYALPLLGPSRAEKIKEAILKAQKIV